jgi:LysM repeat protein
VAIVDPSAGQVADECQELAAVVEAGATRSETLVLNPLSTTPLAATYVVLKGDSLAAIAGAEGVSLATLEALNPQLGPVAGRDWNRIYPGDHVTIPGRQPGDPPSNLLVTRAPAGPPPPRLVPLPQLPKNATSFQLAEYQHALKSAKSINQGRVAAWWTEAATEVRPWQTQVAAQLRGVAGSPEVASLSATRGNPNVAASIEAAATTLDGLPGRRVLLLLGVAQSGPPATALRLAGIHLVVANLSDSAAAAAWASWGRASGASVTALDPALTRLQLPSTVNS